MLNAYFTILCHLNLFPHSHYSSSPNSHIHHSPQVEHPTFKKKLPKIKIQNHNTHQQMTTNQVPTMA
jgi:hypothetical protein